MIDLHIHSTFSDGTLTPTEIVKRAAQNNQINAIALTDHDSIAGVEELKNAGAKYPNLKTIAGVEITTLYGNRELHIVGLFLDHKNQNLNDFLNNLKKTRLDRNVQMAKKLYSLGYEIDREILPYHQKDSIGRLHFAVYLAEHFSEDFTDIQDVFDKLLRRGKSAYVERVLPLPSEAIEAIREAGGISIWAHPIYRERSHERSFLKRMIKKLAPFGLNGIECYYSMFAPYQTQNLLEIAELNNLIASGGSDFHGENRPNVEIAVGGGSMQIPDELLEKMEDFLEKRASINK